MKTETCYSCAGSGVGRVLRDESTNAGYPEDCPTCGGMGQIEARP